MTENGLRAEVSREVGSDGVNFTEIDVDDKCFAFKHVCQCFIDPREGQIRNEKRLASLRILGRRADFRNVAGVVLLESWQPRLAAARVVSRH